VIISPQHAQEAQSLNPRLRVANLAGAGHSIRRDEFGPYMRAVRSFLAEAVR
jgi:hypothetical protein